MPTATESAPGADDEKKSAAEDKQLELFEKTAKMAEKLEEATSRVAAIAESVSERPAAPQPQAAAQPAQARLTPAQVMALVDDKKASMADAMAYLNALAREDAKGEARREAQQMLAELGTRAAAAQTSSLIADYRKHIPGLAQKHSGEWNEVVERFRSLVSEGYPDSLQTELQALRELYGRDPSKAPEREEVRERTKERATRGAEVTSSSASRSSGAPRRSRQSGDSDPDLPADHKTYLEHMIRIGQYKGWDDPRAQKYIERAKSGPARKRSA